MRGQAHLREAEVAVVVTHAELVALLVEAHPVYRGMCEVRTRAKSTNWSV